MITALLLLANGPPADDVRTPVERTPRIVAAFIERRAYCNHFTGEEPYDRARATELTRTLRELRCNRVDRDERNVRRAFRNRPDILRLLDETADAPGW
jgi:hypothetical protein